MTIATDMFKTNRLKIMTAVLGLSLFALAVDRASQGPADAEAAAQEQAQANGAPASKAAPAEQPQATAPPPRRPVAEWLSRFSHAVPADADQIGDVFAPSTGWIAEVKGSDATSVSADVDMERARQFAETHTLTAVMTIGDGGFAIVNGNIIRKGDVVGGFTLIELRSDGAVFRSGKRDVRLDVPVSTR